MPASTRTSSPWSSGGQPVHLHCVVTPVEEPGARLLIELRELDQQLRIAREAKLLEQQQANRELIRNLAHEIKNPLGGIRGAAQLLERELPDPGPARVHAGDREGDRPPAVAHEPAAHAAPAAADRDAQRPRGAGAGAHPAAGRVSRAASPSAATTTSACRTCPATRKAHPGDAQHRAQRRAGDGGHGRDLLPHAHRAPGDDRQEPLPPRRRDARSRTTAPACPAELARRSSFRW